MEEGTGSNFMTFLTTSDEPSPSIYAVPPP